MTSPPGFVPFQPNKPVRIYRRRLPHWRQDGATYFVTFHTNDSLPAEAIKDIQATRERWLRRNPEPHSTEALQELNRLLGARTDRWLDAGHGELWFRDLGNRTELFDAVSFFHKERVDLGAYVCMPNHVHAVLRPLEGFELEDWIGSVKQFVTTGINRREARKGPLWFEEGFDRIVRDLKHLNHCVRYIGRNPKKAGINPQASHLLRLNKDWQALGWAFD